jgi:mRNA interferase RelE/StbE
MTADALPCGMRIDHRAAKTVAKLPAKQRDLVLCRIRELGCSPWPHDFKKLHGMRAFRIDVGEYRVLYEVNDEDKAVEVYTVITRNEGYHRSDRL